MRTSPSHELNKLLTTLESMDVIRFHACPTITFKQTVGQHVSSMATIAIYLAGGIDKVTKDLLVAILTHDQEELFTGDVPASAKWDSSQLADALTKLEQKYRWEFLIHEAPMDEHDTQLFKLADMLDGMHWTSMHERGHRIQAKWTAAVRAFLLHKATHLSEAEKHNAQQLLIQLDKSNA